LGDNINIIKVNNEALTDASDEVGLEVNAEKAKHILTFFPQNEGQNRIDTSSNYLKFWQNSNTSEQG
jgi:hypothetical protein